MLAEHIMHANMVLYDAQATMHSVPFRAIPVERVLSTPQSPGPHCQSHPMCDRLVTGRVTQKTNVPIHEIRDGFDHDMYTV